MRKALPLIAMIALAGCNQRAPQTSEAAARPAAAEAQHVDPRIPSGARLRVRLAQSIDTSRNSTGERFRAHLDRDVMKDGEVLVPKGTVFTGHITTAKSSGRLRGRGVLGLTLDSFELHGKTYPVDTASTSRATRAHRKRNFALIGGGSGVGAALGAIAGGGAGALIGAGAGAAAGTAGAAITGKKNVHLPVETLLSFTVR